MLTLDNFEQVIDSEILARGQRYYTSGRVVSLDEEGGVWAAIVSGTDDYEVTIEEVKGGALSTFCDCPYDWGPYCKHEAAALYAIRAEDKSGRAHVQEKNKSAKQRVRLSSNSRGSSW